MKVFGKHVQFDFRLDFRLYNRVFRSLAWPGFDLRHFIAQPVMDTATTVPPGLCCLQCLWAQMSTVVPSVRWRKHHRRALLWDREPFEGKPTGCTSRLRVPPPPLPTSLWHMLPGSSQRCFCILPAPSPNDTFGLIWEAYSAIHLWWYGGKKRFMSHNKLLRSCMWWGNQKRKWAGNSLLHATLAHPSVRETSPLCTPHLKGPWDDHWGLTVHWSQVCYEVNTGPPCSIWTLWRGPSTAWFMECW